MATRAQTIASTIRVAFFLAVLGVLAFYIYRYISKDTSNGGSYTVFTRLSDATGLVTKSRVKIAGISVGYIDTIALENERARVTMKIDKGIVIRKNGVALKRSASLLGDYNLVINPGATPADIIRDGGEIPSQDSVGTDKIMEDLGVIADRVKAISIQAADAFGTEEGGQKMKAILNNLADVSKEIDLAVKENRENVRESIKNIEQITAASMPKLDRILANVDAISSDFRSVLESKQRAPEGSGVADIQESLTNIRDASKTLESTLQHADSIVARADRGEGTFGRLSKDETLINDVEGVASDIHDLTAPIARLQVIVGLQSEYLLRAGGFKNTVEARIQPREDKYYLVELVSDPRGSISTQQVDVESTNPNSPPYYRTVTTTTTNDFTFSLMYARRFGHCGNSPFCGATFLFGIRESTGGLGLILHGFDDRMELQSDIYGFVNNTYPHLRERLSFEFIKRLWVVAGVDDILNREYLDYFVGARIRFVDEDLKSILPFVSVKP